MIRVGIIGFGKMGRLRRSILEARPGFAVTALCDPFAEPPHVPDGMFTRDPREVLARDDVDAVFVCTPNDVTPGLVISALDQGKHVFAEKPPARTVTEGEAILAAETRNPGLKLKFGFNHRYHDSVQQAYAIAQSGRLGEVMWVRGVYGKSGGKDFVEQWRSRRDVAGGGILLDQGIHMLDLFRLFCGEFVDAKSFVRNDYWPIDVEDNVFAILQGQRGNVAMLHSSSTHWKHTFLLEVYLTGGYLTISGLVTSTRSYGRETLIVGRRQFEDETFALGNPREEVIYFDGDPSWEREVDEFAACITDDRPVEVGSATDACRVLELVHRIYAADPSWHGPAPATLHKAEVR